MTKYLFLTILFFVILAIIFPLFCSSQEPLSKPMVPDSLQGFFKKIFEIWKPINEKGKKWWKEAIEPKIKQWLRDRLQDKKAGLKQSWEEEKQEFKQGIKQTLSNLWQKLKDLINQ